jgi:crotonobetainyl-CoA:carnitine CoA-transferase CaiB-like acyl-CoA transferase
VLGLFEDAIENPDTDGPARDGLLIIACLIQGFWARLCETLGRPDLVDDPRYATSAARLANRDTLNAEIAAITATRTVADWVDRLTANDVPHAPILGVGAAFDLPHSKARDMVVSAHHPRAGEVRMVGRPIKFPGMTQAPLAAAPVLGQHTVDVLTTHLGLSPEQIDKLRQEGVIDRITQVAGSTS